MSVGESFTLIEDFLSITYVQNPGAAWGLMSDNRWILIILPLLLAAGICFFIYKNPEIHWIEKIALTMIATGGLGNLIDRVYLGKVVDMISFSFFSPVFNVADIAVTTGCGIIILFIISQEFAGAKVSKDE